MSKVVTVRVKCDLRDRHANVKCLSTLQMQALVELVTRISRSTAYTRM
jgi:hypothetical protein